MGPIHVILVGLLILPAFGGCLGIGEAEEELGSTTPELSLTYQAEGPLYVAGFWTNSTGEHVSAEPGSVLNVTLTPGRDVIDASGHKTYALNLTYRFQGESVTHWVHPGSGKLVVMEQHLRWAALWTWQVSGMDALFGQFSGLRTDTPLADTLTVTCCPAPKVFAQPANGSLSLTLVERTGAVEWLGQEPSGPWEPPGPRDVSRYAWEGQHIPHGEAWDFAFPLSDAIQEIRESCEGGAEYMDRHPDWWTAAAVWDKRQGPVPALTTEEAWTIALADQEDEGYTASASYEYVATGAGTQEEGVASCSTGPVPDELPWQEADPDPRVLGYTDAWATLEAVAQPDEVPFYGTGFGDRAGGPLVAASIGFDPFPVPSERYDNESRSLGIDVETGLFDHYFGPEPPVNAIKQPLGAAEPVDEPTGVAESACSSGVVDAPSEEGCPQRFARLGG